jgi:hypothetical protein
MVERQHSAGVGDVVNTSISELLQQNVKLSLTVINSLANGGSDASELQAAFLLMEKTNAAAREVVAFVGSNGFEKPLIPGEDGAASEEGQESHQELMVEEELASPKTFGELFDLRTEEFLPKGKKIRISVLKKITRNKAGIRNVVKAGGFLRVQSVVREDAAKILRSYLTNTTARLKDSYERKDIAGTFFVGKGEKEILDGFAKEISFDWSGLISQEEALSLKGLKALYDIKMNKVRRTAKKAVVASSTEMATSGTTTEKLSDNPAGAEGAELGLDDASNSTLQAD